MAVSHHTQRLYVQPRMFDDGGACPTMSQLSLCSVSGVWSIGGQIIDLASLEPLAITALPGQTPVQARAEAHQFLDELLDVMAELAGLGPFD